MSAFTLHLCWCHDEKGVYRFVAVHSRALTDADYRQADERVSRGEFVDGPVPVVFLDAALRDAELCSFLAAKSRRLLASPPTPRRDAPS